MTFPRTRLIVSACLFLGWIGFLVYLVAQTPATILSGPQFLAASLYVVADIRADAHGRPDPHVKIEEVIWSAHLADRHLAGQLVWLAELAWYQKQLGLQKDTVVPARDRELAEYLKQLGFQGPGKYLLPLSREDHGAVSAYSITPIPRFGRYPAPPASVELPVFLFLDNAEAMPFTAASRMGSLGLPLGPAPMAAVCAPWPGIDLQKVIQCLSEDDAMKKEAAAKKRAAAMELVARWKTAKAPIVVAQRWPVQDALYLQKKLLEAGVDASLIDEAVRIYPWKPETRTQVLTIVASKRI